MVFLAWVNELLEPCFTCKPEDRVSRSLRRCRALRSEGREAPHTKGQHQVELAVSPLAGLRGVAGYHTSILVAGEEYYFSPFGICCSPKVVSHCVSSEIEFFPVGLTRRSGPEMLDRLTEHFAPGTYDLLRKNCNSFTDCAMYFLCGRRLEAGFRVLEEFGLVMEDHAGLVRSFSMGAYIPNDKAADFELEEVIESLDVDIDEGHLTGAVDPDRRACGDCNLRAWPRCTRTASVAGSSDTDSDADLDVQSEASCDSDTGRDICDGDADFSGRVLRGDEQESVHLAVLDWQERCLTNGSGLKHLRGPYQWSRRTA